MESSTATCVHVNTNISTVYKCILEILTQFPKFLKKNVYYAPQPLPPTILNVDERNLLKNNYQARAFQLFAREYEKAYEKYTESEALILIIEYWATYQDG